jgi:hypothetical protein
MIDVRVKEWFPQAVKGNRMWFDIINNTFEKGIGHAAVSGINGFSRTTNACHVAHARRFNLDVQRAGPALRRLNHHLREHGAFR